MSKRCTQTVVATDVEFTADGVTQRWPRLEARCKRKPGHGGVHAYGPWTTPEGGEPFAPPPNDYGPEREEDFPDYGTGGGGQW